MSRLGAWIHRSWVHPVSGTALSIGPLLVIVTAAVLVLDRPAWRPSLWKALPAIHLLGLWLGSFVVGCWMLATILASLVQLVDDAGVDDTRRLPWALLLISAGPLSVPVYWWRHIRVRPQRTPT